MKYLLRYGELGLKSSRVRKSMKDRLTQHVSRLFTHAGTRCHFREEHGRLFLESEDKEAGSLLGRAFGLVSFSPVRETSARQADIVNLCVEVARTEGVRPSTFAIRARRVGDHDYTSMELARVVGAAIQTSMPNLEVDLDDPDLEISLEVRGEKAFVYVETVPGPGGLPLGTQGKVVSLVDGADGVMASWLMMKRGCFVVPTYLEQEKWSHALSYWDPDTRWRQIRDMKGMAAVAEEERALGYVYPWGASDISGGDLRPAFYPLMSLSARDFGKLRARILSHVEIG